jgi:hypothetical protein
VGLLAAPATAQAPDPSQAMVVIGYTAVSRGNLAHWLDVAQQSAAEPDVRSQTMQFVLSSVWVRGEATEQGTMPSEAYMRQQFELQRRQAYPKYADYARFLRESHLTEADLLYRITTQEASNRLRKKIEDAVPNPTDAEVFQEIRSWGERRDYFLISRPTRAGVLKARAAGRTGLLLRDERRAPHESKLGKAIWRARPHRWVGPLRSGGYWFAFRVVRVRPPGRAVTKELRDAVRDLLRSERKQAAVDAFVKTFVAKWRARTTCVEGTEWTQTCLAVRDDTT